MVKLEDVDGGWLYINPNMVVSLTPVDGHEITRICLTESDMEDVKGTPDEVHAKLFPEVPKRALETYSKREADERREREANVRLVLEYVEECGIGHAGPISPSIVKAARKALGREGT